jgi:hypothetical protein
VAQLARVEARRHDRDGAQLHPVNFGHYPNVEHERIIR